MINVCSAGTKNVGSSALTNITYGYVCLNLSKNFCSVLVSIVCLLDIE